MVSGPQLARLLGDWHGRDPDYLTLAAAVPGLVLDGRLSLQVRLPPNGRRHERSA